MAGAKHGSTAVFKVQDAGAVLRDLSAFLTQEDINRTADTAETTAFGLVSKSYIPGLKDGTISLAGNYDAVATTGIAVVLEGILALARPFEFYPSGTTTGERKYTGSCILTKFSVSSPINNEVSVSADFQITGDVTVAANP